jgi:hypothetical protein
MKKLRKATVADRTAKIMEDLENLEAEGLAYGSHVKVFSSEHKLQGVVPKLDDEIEGYLVFDSGHKLQGVVPKLDDEIEGYLKTVRQFAHIDILSASSTATDERLFVTLLLDVKPRTIDTYVEDVCL